MADEQLQRAIETRVEALGFELVDLETAGSKTRPILRLRIDLPDGSTPGHGVTVDDCTRVSRDVEAFLDERGEVGERYVLEVSSPGLERPLVRHRDFERFAGQEVMIQTREAVAGLGKRLEGVLRGIDLNDVVSLDVAGQSIQIAQGNIKKAHLVFKWGQK
jgi:ribosome maturation factor RimP